jgi:precorrin-6B methylase 2
MSVDRVMALALPLLGSAESVAAVGAALRLQRDGSEIPAEVRARLDAVLDVLEIRDAVEALEQHEAAALLGLVEGLLAQDLDLIEKPGRVRWEHESTSILMAQGQMSALMAGVFAQMVVPTLGEDFAARLQAPGASFLDIGAGVAALSVAMCRMWPSLRVVGIDPWDRALELARAQVATSGFEDRIELRQSTGEAIDDSEQHDLAWVPTFFIPGTALPAILERVREALRPGGCVVVGIYTRPADPLAAALAELRTLRQGGAVVTPEEVAGALEQAGYAGVDVVIAPERQLPVVCVAGRRAEA